MRTAILERDFPAFAELTMKDSDHFHEVCHTTDPPIHYMNETSFDVVKLVRAFNANGAKVSAFNAYLKYCEQRVTQRVCLIWAKEDTIIFPALNGSHTAGGVHL